MQENKLCIIIRFKRILFDKKFVSLFVTLRLHCNVRISKICLMWSSHWLYALWRCFAHVLICKRVRKCVITDMHFRNRNIEAYIIAIESRLTHRSPRVRLSDDFCVMCDDICWRCIQYGVCRIIVVYHDRTIILRETVVSTVLDIFSA